MKVAQRKKKGERSVIRKCDVLCDEKELCADSPLCFVLYIGERRLGWRRCSRPNLLNDTKRGAAD